MILVMQAGQAPRSIQGPAGMTSTKNRTALLGSEETRRKTDNTALIKGSLALEKVHFEGKSALHETPHLEPSGQVCFSSPSAPKLSLAGTSLPYCGPT
jgi:hypothetical protein